MIQEIINQFESFWQNEANIQYQYNSKNKHYTTQYFRFEELQQQQKNKKINEYSYLKQQQDIAKEVII